jgi:hypothetical protein
LHLQVTFHWQWILSSSDFSLTMDTIFKWLFTNNGYYLQVTFPWW